LMSIDPLVELKFSEEFKNKLRNLSKKYRNIRADLQSILDELQVGNFQGDQIANVGYTVFKLRIKNRDNKKGKKRRLQGHLLRQNSYIGYSSYDLLKI
jgi:mRNA-degrading endonuclease RelE of RelBE toxin-antitoxin system